MKKLFHLILFAAQAVGVTSAMADFSHKAAPSEALIARTSKTFIFTFNDNVPAYLVEFKAAQIAARHNANIAFVYKNALKGFAAEISDVEAAKVPQNFPDVVSFERDAIVTTAATVAGTTASTWGVTRVGGSQPATAYAKAWVIDTGVQYKHPALVVDEANAYSAIAGKNADDENGHGTHVSGTIAANGWANAAGVAIYGVAAGAAIVPVRVLDATGSGSLSAVVAGVDYVTGKRKTLCPKGYAPGPCAAEGWVVNMSLELPANIFTKSLDTAVTNAANVGVRFAVAAGNSALKATTATPARVNHANVFTVSASWNKKRLSPRSGSERVPDGSASVGRRWCLRRKSPPSPHPRRASSAPRATRFSGRAP
ncbi:S8 family serine peptidase [Methylocystis parvus]|uniref:S8 family serine peptidase n=1 Tax=Methylocystis parvus TaxID=134 RepID=UPI003C77360A